LYPECEASQPDPFDLVLGKPVLRTVIKLRRTRALVRRHFLGVLERSAIGEIGGDPSGAHSVDPDLPGYARCPRPTPDHSPAAGLPAMNCPVTSQSYSILLVASSSFKYCGETSFSGCSLNAATLCGWISVSSTPPCSLHPKNSLHDRAYARPVSGLPTLAVEN